MPAPDDSPLVPATVPPIVSRNLFELLPLGIVVTNEDDRIIEVNGTAVRQLGIARPSSPSSAHAIATETLVRADGTRLPHDEHPSVRARREDRVFLDEQIGAVAADGSTVWFQVTATPLRGIGVLTTYYEVTTSRQTEEDLRHHIEQLDAFFETNLDLLAILNSEGRAVRLNPAWAVLLGYEPDQLHGARLFDFLHPNDMEATLGGLARLRTRREVVGFVNRVRTRAGAYRFLEWRATARDDLIYATARDITDQRLAEAALRESEARFRAIFEQAAVGVAEVDLETGSFVKVNQRFCEIVGYSEEEMLVRSFQELTHPDDLPTDLALYQRCRSGESAEFSREKRYIHKDGRTVWINLQVKVPSGSGSNLRHTFVSVIEDITERKETDELLRRSLADVLEANQRLNFQITRMPLAYIAWNKDFQVTEWNASAERIFGWSASEALGRHANDLLVPPEERPAMTRVWQSIMEGGEFGSQYTTENFTRDGRRIKCEWFNAGWIDASGRTVGFLSMIHDISERLRIEEKLLHSQRMESLGSFAGGVAHDMNNVIRTILTAAQSLEGHEHGNGIDKGLDTIVQACTRGRTLLRSLLDFARQDVTEAQVVDINGILHEQIRLLDRLLPPSVTVTRDLDPALPTIAGDPMALGSAVMHLLINAIDAMPTGGVLTLRTRLRPDDCVEIEVQDTGAGMSKQVLDRALDPFFTTKPHGKGDGLGLPAVYGAVKAHHGHLELRSQPGRGTQVNISLPISPTTSTSSAHLAQVRDPGPSQGLRILLVDDDDLVQTAVSAQLRRLGHSIVMAENGREAVDKVEAGLQVDLVMLDIDMPVLDGSKALPMLRRLQPDLPVIIETGNLGEKAEQLVSAYQDVALLVRPFSLAELKAAIDPWLARGARARGPSQ